MGPMPLRVAGGGAKHSPLHPGALRATGVTIELMRKNRVPGRFSNFPELSEKSSGNIAGPAGNALELPGRFLDDFWGFLKFSIFSKSCQKSYHF